MNLLKNSKPKNTDKVISNLKNMPARMNNFLILKIEYRQLLAMWMICLLLLPVFSLPVSAAATLDTRENNGQFEPVNKKLPILNEIWRGLNEEIETLTASYRTENIVFNDVDNANNDGNKRKEDKAGKEASKTVAGDEKPVINTLDEISEKEKVNTLIKRVAGIQTPLSENVIIQTGQSLNLSAKPVDKKGNTINGVEVNWQSSNTEIIEIRNAQAFAVKEGNATLTAVSGKSSKTIKVRVEKVQANTNVSNSAVLDDDEYRNYYSPQNNLGRPSGQVEAQAPNGAAAISRTLERPGIGNFSFDVPIASLPGRGIDAGAVMSYNSQVWEFWTSPIGNISRFRYNSDADWLSPGFKLGFGKLERVNYYTYNLTSPDGTRHEFSYVSGGSSARTYESNDGTFMRLDMTYNTVNGTDYVTSSVLKYSDGTIVTFSPVNGVKCFPTQITDKNGNFIQIAYKQNDTDGRILYIKDTLSRYINFYYDSGNKLVAVTVPGYDNSSERQTIRFYYETMNFDTSVQRFSNTTAIMPSSIQALKFVYFPGTNTGYKYEYSSGYGMIYKVSDLRGMQVSSNSLTETGLITDEGQTSATTTYDYPLTVGAPLSNSPRYNTRTDDWAGRTVPQSPVTTYSVERDTANSLIKSKITSPDGTITESWTKVAPNQWDDGLVTDTFIKTMSGPQLQTYKVWSHTKLFWGNQTGVPGRQNPVVTKVETTNDAGQTKATAFEYDGYNNQTVATEYDFAPPGQLGTELERSEVTYETRSNWINRRILNLPVVVRRMVNNTVVSRTDFEYDNYGAGEIDMIPRGDIIMFDQTYNPSSGSYNSNTKYRGNVTRVTAFSNATLSSDSNASVTTVKYDMAGNEVESSANCCNKFVWGYSKSTEYAYQMSETRGLNSELQTSATYDLNTGLVKTSVGENNQVMNFTYDPNSLRQIRVDRPDGGYSTLEYQDNLVNGPNNLKWSYVKSTTKIEINKEVSKWSYMDGRGAEVRSLGSQFNGEYQGVTDIEYNAMGQVARISNPYAATSFSSPINPSNNWTTPVYDPLNRTVLVTLPDGNTTQTEFNGVVLTVTDQAGKKRRQIVNALAHVVRTDEPDANGDLGSVGSPVQPTYYEYDGNYNLSKVTQTEGGVTQERIFKYDSLSRITHEKQIEEIPTLDGDGLKVGSAGQWTKVYKYNSSGLLVEGTDPRGVKASFTYDTLNRMKTVIYTGETGYQTPNITYTYDEQRTGFFNKGGLTKIETAQGETDAPATAQVFDYDLMGRIKKETQTVGTNNYTLEYGYNLAGQLISEKYPSGRTVNLQFDSIGRPSTISDAQRVYASNYQYASHGALTSVNFGNGTIGSYGYNSQRLQLTNQSLTKGSDIIQKYEYGYGKIDLATGILDASKNNGQLARINSYIGGTTSAPTKQWQQRFDYDELGRLREVREYRGDTNALSYKYISNFDRFGNRFKKSSSNQSAGQETPLTYQWIENSDIDKTNNRFSAATGTQYDDAGNITRDTKFRNLDYKYDANGRMIATKLVNGTGADATSVYNGLGKRVATKINDVWRILIYDFNGQVVSEYDGLTPADEGGVKYVMQDIQSSTRAILNQSGFVQARFDYQAYGEEIGSNTGMRTAAQGFGSNQPMKNRYALTERDEASGLDHTLWRKLENQSGRWTSPDPYKGAMNLGDPQSFNRYAYVNNDPVNFIDPTGLYTACIHEAMTRFLGEIAGLKKDVLDALVKYVGDDTEDSADGWNIRADNPMNFINCEAGESYPSREIHFATLLQMNYNQSMYSKYINAENYSKAAYMLHSLEDGYGAHRGFNGTCDHIADKGVDNRIGDGKFNVAANHVLQAMTGDNKKSLSPKQLKNLVEAVNKACPDDVKVRPRKRRGGGRASGGGGGIRSGGGGISDAHAFTWLELIYGLRRYSPARARRTGATVEDRL